MKDYYSIFKKRLEETNLNKNKKKLIYDIINDKKWYLKVSFDLFVSILNDLNYSKNDILEIYKELMIKNAEKEYIVDSKER